MFNIEAVPLPTSYEVCETECAYSDDSTQLYNDMDTDIILETEEEFVQPLETNNLKTTSGYGNRINPVSGKKEFHYGIDLVGGTKILATADGQVVKVVNKGSKGGVMCLIRIQHKDYQSAYYHIKSGSALVKVGDYVKKGQQIATIGNTGKVTGTHLHFQIDKGSNATSINPTKYAYGEKELAGLSKPDYKKGNYKVVSPRYVRVGPGTEYRIKKVAELTADGKKHCVNPKLTANAQYKAGTIFTALDIVYAKNHSVWARTPSGYVCLTSHTGVQYCSKV